MLIQKNKYKKLNLIIGEVLVVGSLLAITISCSNNTKEIEPINEPIKLKDSSFSYPLLLENYPFKFLDSKKIFIIDKEKLKKPGSIIQGIYKFTNNQENKTPITDEDHSVSTNDNLLVIYQPSDNYVFENEIYAKTRIFSFRNIYIDDNQKAPIFKGISGAGIMDASNTDIKYATTTYEWKNADGDSYKSLNINDSNFSNGETVRVTWTANNGYLFHNNKSIYSQEYQITNLKTTTSKTHSIKFDFDKHKPIFTGVSGSGRMDISQVSTPNTTVKYEWKNASGGSYKSLNTNDSDFGNGETVRITWFAKYEYLLDINNKQLFNYSREYVINNLTVDKSEILLPFNYKKNEPIFSGISGGGTIDVSQVAIPNTTVKYEWKNASGGSYKSLNINDTNFRNGETIRITWTASDGYLFDKNKSKTHIEEYPIYQLLFKKLNYLETPKAELSFSGVSGNGVMNIPREITNSLNNVSFKRKLLTEKTFRNLDKNVSDLRNGEIIQVIFKVVDIDFNIKYLFGENKSSTYIKEYIISSLSANKIANIDKATSAPTFSGISGIGTMDISQVPIPNTTVKYELINKETKRYETLVTNVANLENGQTIRVAWIADNGYLFNNKEKIHYEEYVIDSLTAKSQIDIDWSTKSPTFSGVSGIGTMDIAQVPIPNTTVKYEWKSSNGGSYKSLNTSATDFGNRETVRITWTANNGYIFKDQTKTHIEEYLINSLTAKNQIDIDWSTKSPTFSGVSGSGTMDISQVSTPNTTVKYEWKNASGGSYQSLNTNATDFGNREMVMVTWTANNGYIFKGQTKTHIEEYLIDSLTENQIDIDWSTKSPTFSGVSGSGTMDISQVSTPNTTVKYEWKNASGGSYQSLNTSATDFGNREMVMVTWTANNGYIFKGQTKTHIEEYLIDSLTENQIDIDWSTKLPTFSGVSGSGTMDISQVSTPNTTVKYEWKNANGGSYQSLNTSATNFGNRETVRITWTANNGYIFSNGKKTYQKNFIIKNLLDSIHLTINWTNHQPKFIKDSNDNFIANITDVEVDNTSILFEWKESSTSNFQILTQDEIIAKKNFIKYGVLKITWAAHRGFYFSNGESIYTKDFVV